jgi:hypothetical protein
MSETAPQDDGVFDIGTMAVRKLDRPGAPDTNVFTVHADRAERILDGTQWIVPVPCRMHVGPLPVATFARPYTIAGTVDVIACVPITPAAECNDHTAHICVPTTSLRTGVLLHSPLNQPDTIVEGTEADITDQHAIDPLIPTPKSATGLRFPTYALVLARP